MDGKNAKLPSIVVGCDRQAFDVPFLKRVVVVLGSSSFREKSKKTREVGKHWLQTI